jgi:cell division septation protein DedD
MDSSLKQRLVGAVVLVALAVIFLPMLVKGPAPDSGVSDVSLDVPPEPRGAGDVRTVDLPLVVPDARGGSATGMPAPVQGPVAAPAADAPLFVATAAGDYAVSFGSYASAADADRVIAALRSAELPAYREAASIGGRPAQRVRIGPFADRAMAESARLRAAHVRDDVDARVIALDAGTTTPAAAPASTTTPAPVATVAKPVALPPANPPTASAPAVTPAPAPAATPTPPKPAPAPVAAPADTSKTGFAVQVGAFADAAAAIALRDRLRGAGFNAFTDAVETDAGRRTRVRVGPAMTRADADALKAQVKARLGIDGIVRPHP